MYKTAMIPKRPHHRFTYEEALAIVRGYHRDGLTQTTLAEGYGVHTGHINKIVHGQVYREAYEQVKAELAAAAVEAEASRNV